MHTLTVADPDQAVTLVVFVVVAALVSGAVELAVRRAHAAERAREEAETLSALAGPELEAEESLREILQRGPRDVPDGVGRAEGRDSAGAGEWVDVEHVGWAPPGEEAPLRFDVPIGSHLRMVGRGPALFAEDQRVLEAFAGAARTAYEGQVLSGEAKEGADPRRPSTAANVASGGGRTRPAHPAGRDQGGRFEPAPDGRRVVGR